MSTLDEYFAPRVPGSGKNAIAGMILVSVDLGNASGRCTLACKLHALLHVVRELQGEVGYAGVNSIRDYLLMEGVVKSEFEVPKLLKLAHNEGLVREGPIPSTWMAVNGRRAQPHGMLSYSRTGHSISQYDCAVPVARKLLFSLWERNCS